ncbi:MAG: 5-formyltetrahydrofolate cyclo-ligase [Thermoproteota archaeon]|nr:5-formyltetrahydrofolate cyclo-ligase [Thermoproteota archaeon]
MTLNPEKAALRKHLLEKRDSTSFDLMEIHSKKICSKLSKTKIIAEAKSIGCYSSIGSEVQTNEIINYLLNENKVVSLPKVEQERMTFRQIDDMTRLEKGEFDIPEPKDNTPIQEQHDIILVPCVGLDNQGNRIGYGFGFYDKYLEGNNATKIALAYSKQIVKTIPTSMNDIKMDWIITEKDIIKIS